jgi:betaine-aldehyde dehydrogenase
VTTGTAPQRTAIPDLRAPTGRIFIGGRWEEPRSGATAASENPADETVLTRVPVGSVDDIDAAVAAARQAAPDWARAPWTERAASLRELADRLLRDGDRLALIDTLDSGNPIAGSRADVGAAAAALEHFAGLGGQVRGETIPSPDGVLTFTDRVPHGVVGRIMAYNHPLMFAAQGVAAALVSGNAVVMKPAEPTVLSSLEFAALSQGLLPDGVLNVVPGDGAAGGHLVRHPDVPRIAFTGSVATGRRILSAAAPQLKRVSLELGGKNALIVYPDADPVMAAEAAVRGMNFTRTNGQSCMSTSRVLVHVDVQEEFEGYLAERIRALRVGRPEEPATDVGPLAFRAHRDRVMAHIATAREQGARVAVGGERPVGLTRGYYVEATLLLGVEPPMAIAREEVFGPVLAVLGWSDEGQVIRLANDTTYGLTANVLTNDLQRALRAAAQVEAGVVWVNGPVPLPPGTPFGGIKSSGLGREHGLEELLSYTESKSVVVNYGARPRA